MYVDYPLGKIFTGKSTGINPETGIYNYELRPDADIQDLADQRDYKNYLFYIGTSSYPWTGGLSTNVSWKNWSLSISTSFSLGAKIVNHIKSPASYSDATGGTNNSLPTSLDIYDVYAAHLNRDREAAHRWTPDNTVTDGYPRLIDAHGTDLNLSVDQPTLSSVLEGVYYENGSYWKIGSMTLSYSLPDHLCRKMALSSVGVSFTANNLWVITAYKGMNPESPGAVYPMSRSFSLGLNLGF